MTVDNTIVSPSVTVTPNTTVIEPGVNHHFTLDLASREIGALAAALAAAQGEFLPVEKDQAVTARYWDKASNGYVTRVRRYASLDSLLRSVRLALSTHDLALLQRAIPAPSGHHGLETLLLHASGQWIGQQSFLSLATLTDKQDVVQVSGATITYHRRYSLGAFLAVAPEEDTDAENTHTAPNGEQDAPAPSTAPPPAPQDESKRRTPPPPDDDTTARDRAARAMFAAFREYLGVEGKDPTARDARHNVARAVVGEVASFRDLTTQQCVAIRSAIEADPVRYAEIAAGRTDPGPGELDPFAEDAPEEEPGNE